MALNLSTGLKNAMLASSSCKAAMEGAAGFVIDIYSGSRPASADRAATGTKLITVSLGGAGTGMHFATAAVSGALPNFQRNVERHRGHHRHSGMVSGA